MTPEQIQGIAKKLRDVFTPSTPVSDTRLLRGRARILEDIQTAIDRRGAHIVLYGERGVGKSSIARIVSQFADGEPFYYAASEQDTFDTIAVSILQHYGVNWTPESRERKSSTTSSASLRIPNVATAGVSNDTGQGERDTQLTTARLTSQQIATRLPSHASLVVIDEFERLGDSLARATFADLIKKLSDNGHPTTLMLVGIADNIDELLSAHESARRSVVEIKVERLTNPIIREIIDVGVGELGLEIDPDTASHIVTFSARFPHYTHLLCEGAVRHLLGRLESDESVSPIITKADLGHSILYAIRNAERSIIRSYDQAVRSIRDSPRFKYCLYAIASWPTEPVPYGDICRWVGALVDVSGKAVNVSHQLKRLETLDIIRRESTGLYRFANPMLKAYVILKARADTPENELKAIDAQLGQVKKRMDLLKERFPAPSDDA